MKKKIIFVFVLVLALSMLLVNTSGEVYAAINPQPQKTSLAAGTWSTGTEVEINLKAAQYQGLQLLTRGVKISQPTNLCHEFRGGQFGWVAEIRLLKNGVWIKQPTRMGWEPDTEGTYMACIDASSAGTYALFGWFDSTRVKVSEEPGLPVCDNSLILDATFHSTLDSDSKYSTGFSFLIPSMPFTTMTFTITKALGTDASELVYETDLFNSTDNTSDVGGLSLNLIRSSIEPGYIDGILTTPTCYFILTNLTNFSYS